MRLRRSRRPVPALPDGRQFALTWEIPDNFGGLTKAMLQRSGAFAASGDRPVSILTFALQLNLEDIRADLRTRGLLGEGVTINNLWEDVRALPDDILRKAVVDPKFTGPREFASVEGEPLLHAGVELARVERAAGREESRVWILRADGSVVATQLWARVSAGDPMCEFGDVVIETALYARDGSLIGGWNGSWGLWQFWIDLSIADPDSYAIVDSSVIADCLAHRGPGGATMLYLFHNNHLARRREPPYAPLDRWRRYVSQHHADFDANVFLTDTQRLDFGRLLPGVDNSHTVPNIVTVSSAPSQVERVAGRGVVLARLSPQKRLDHALRAVSAASGSHPDLRLDLYGHGPREEELRALAEDLGGPIAFHGYTASPAKEFARSSFSVLTSTHEGLGLTVIESMAAGCVPLAYDVPYGPSDIITHGVDGFLVPAGNHRAMAKQIDEFLALDAHTADMMRDAGRKRAEAYAAEPVIAMWGEVMRAARRRHTTTKVQASPEALSAQEKRAAATRFAPTAAHAELIDASWPDDQLLRMTVRTHLSGGPVMAAPEQRDVVAKLIHRPTGAARPIPLSFRSGLDQPNDPPGSRYVALDIDVSQLSGDLDHTVLLTHTLDGDPAWDVIRTRRRVHDWLAFPGASANRPVVLFDKNRGVELTTASPKVAATARAEGNEVTLKLVSLISGTIESVQAVGRKGSPTIEADRVSTAAFRLRLPPSGKWEVRAKIDGTLRLVAWGATSEELHAAGDWLDPVRIGASARGYLHLESSPSRVAVTDLGEDVVSQIIVESTETPAAIVAVDAAGTEHLVPTVGQADGRNALDLSVLSAGTYTLRSGTGANTPIVAEVQDLLPRSATHEKLIVTARRAPRKNALLVEVSAAPDL